jgi:hypothetical protein
MVEGSHLENVEGSGLKINLGEIDNEVGKN